jgi:hypothetical protein
MIYVGCLQFFLPLIIVPLLYNIFINDLCDVINHSNCLPFADDLKVYEAISSPSDCLLLQSDIDRVHNLCLANSSSSICLSHSRSVASSKLSPVLERDCPGKVVMW